jgi:hypothetical protein
LQIVRLEKIGSLCYSVCVRRMRAINSCPQEERMGRSPRWQLCLLLLLLAMIVGFTRVEHLKESVPAPGRGAQEDDTADGENEPMAGDPVGDFLADVIGDGSGRIVGPTPVPLIPDLPVLPEAFWPLSRPRSAGDPVMAGP